MIVGCGYHEKIQVYIEHACQQLKQRYTELKCTMVASIIQQVTVVILGLMPVTNVASVANSVASSQLPACLCYLYLMFYYFSFKIVSVFVTNFGMSDSVVIHINIFICITDDNLPSCSLQHIEIQYATYHVCFQQQQQD